MHIRKIISYTFHYYCVTNSPLLIHIYLYVYIYSNKPINFNHNSGHNIDIVVEGYALEVPVAVPAVARHAHVGGARAVRGGGQAVVRHQRYVCER